MTRVAPHPFKGESFTEACVAIIGGQVCGYPQNSEYHSDPFPVYPPVSVVSRDEAVNAAVQAAQKAHNMADAMANDTTASRRMVAEVWAQVSEAWSSCAVLLPDPPPVEVTYPESIDDDSTDWQAEAKVLADHVNQAQRIIGAMFERLPGADSIVINADDWERMNGASITVTVTGDGNRVIRRAS